MFYVLSKVAWFLATPSNLLPLLALSALAFAWTRIAAAGIVYIIHRMTRRRAAAPPADEDVAVPALNTGQTRLYDPDLPSRHPLADGADPKRIEA